MFLMKIKFGTPFLTDFGPILVPRWSQNGSKHGSKPVSKINFKNDWNFDPFLEVQKGHEEH